jgi:hypothetical protein
MHRVTMSKHVVRSGQFDAFFPVFPAGTLLGALKIRRWKLSMNLNRKRGLMAVLGYLISVK